MVELTSLEFFRDFSKTEAASFTRQMVPVSYDSGEVIFKEGESSHVMMIIVRGQVKVMKRIDDTNMKMLALLESGDVFGEISFFDFAPHNATVIAHNEVSVLAISQKDFNAFVTKDPKTGYKVMRRIIQVCGTRIRLLNEEVKQLAQWCLTIRSNKRK